MCAKGGHTEMIWGVSGYSACKWKLSDLKEKKQ